MLMSDPETKSKIIVFPKKKERLAHLRQYCIWYLMLLMLVFLGIGLVVWKQTFNFKQTNYQHSENTHKKKVQAESVSVQNPVPAVAVASEVGQPETAFSNTIQLQAGDKVIFVGDSIMQGIAPHVQQWLKNKYEIDSFNLSQPNMGLLSSDFFDWAETLEQHLQDDKQIKLVVILLGMHDALDFAELNAPKDTPLVKFQTIDWEKAYLLRVQRLVQSAKNANAKILWLGIPHMKSPILNQKMDYVDNVLANEFKKNPEDILWLKTSDLLSDGEQVYRDSIVLDGETVQIRMPDGVHFSERGQEFMADYIASYISVQQ